jgi:quinol monooxygenase YgiN
MHARSTTFHGSPEQLDQGIAYVRDKVMPAVLQMDGCVGISMLADRATGRCIATTSWDDADAMHNSRDGVRSIRERTAELLGGQPEIQEWEVALMHRARDTPDGACTRLVWSRCEPDAMDRAVDAYRSTELPELEHLDGFCSVSLLVARAEGRAVAAVTFTARAAMERSRSETQEMRDKFAMSTGAAVTDVGEFDLVLAHLRVPEMA